MEPDYEPGTRNPDPAEPVPWQQRLFDRPFLLLLLGVAVTGLFYTLWGLIEIQSLPPAPLP